MNKPEAAKLMAVLLAAFPNSKANAQTSEVYERMLADLAYEHVNAALTVLIQTRTFMPSVHEIREAVVALTIGRAKTGLEAWGSVVNAMKREGFYRTPGVDFQFRDPVTARAVAAMGWQDLCSSENPVADRARFIDAYEQMAKSDRQAEQSPVLKSIERGDAMTVVNGLARALEVKSR